MAQWANVRRVVIIADTAIETPILEHILKVGARGYNCIYCFGKGRHEPLEDPHTGRSRVRIEVLARDDVAEQIMDYIHEPEFISYAVTGFSDTVEVDSRDIGYF